MRGDNSRPLVVTPGGGISSPSDPNPTLKGTFAMTARQRLTESAARFIRLAPTDAPTLGSVSPELSNAFRQYRYWDSRVLGATPKEAAAWAAQDERALLAGAYNPLELDPFATHGDRRWYAVLRNAEWYANAPTRLKARILAVSTPTA